MGEGESMIFTVEDICFEPRPLLKCLCGCKVGYYFCPTVKDVSTAGVFSEIVKRYKWGVIMLTSEIKKGQDITLALETRAFLAGYYFALGATECAVCKSCSFPEGKPCRDKSRQRLPLYAYGIDVYKTVRGLGLELEVVQRKGDPAKNITAVFVE